MSVDVDSQHPKALQILQGAREAFLELGYEGTSVDDIARRAGVSKPTLYVHFGDKRAVFTAVVKRECEAHAKQIFEIAPEPGHVGEALLSIATHYIAFLLTPSTQDIFRVAVAESQRFPDLGRAFYDSGPGLGGERLAAFLRVAVERKELAIEDVNLAAHQFTELCRADLFYRRLLRGDAPDEREMKRVARSAVDMFLRAYRAPSCQGRPEPGATTELTDQRRNCEPKP